MATNVHENTHKDSGLKHGQFKVKFLTEDFKEVEHIVNPLTQEEIAEGWQIKMPHAHKDSTIHHFSVYLSQLPPHLWKSLYKTYNEDGEHYRTIHDGIYQYSIKMSKYDSYLQKLYTLLMLQYPDIDQVSKLYEHLEKQRVKGWIMIRAKNLINP